MGEQRTENKIKLNTSGGFGMPLYLEKTSEGVYLSLDQNFINLDESEIYKLIKALKTASSGKYITVIGGEEDYPLIQIGKKSWAYKYICNW